MDDIEPDVMREMTVQPLRVPEFSAHVSEGDLADLDKRDRKLILAFSKMGQQVGFIIDQLVIINGHLRRLEAEQIRQRRAQAGTNWGMAIVKWVGVTLGAGTVAAAARKLFGS